MYEFFKKRQKVYTKIGLLLLLTLLLSYYFDTVEEVYISLIVICLIKYCIDKNRLSDNIKVIYCPRCGFEGPSCLKLFTRSIFSDFCYYLMIIFLSMFLCLCIFLFPLFILIVGLSILNFLTNCFERVCPVCKYIAVIDLKEHLKKSKNKDYIPLHLISDNRQFDKNNEIIPWW